jgi:hypothetical protein
MYLHDAGTCSCVEVCLEFLRSPKANAVLVGPLTHSAWSIDVKRTGCYFSVFQYEVVGSVCFTGLLFDY